VVPHLDSGCLRRDFCLRRAVHSCGPAPIRARWRRSSLLNALLDLNERVAPRLAIYPRRAQLLFGIAFASVLASAFIYIAAAPSAKSRLRQHLNLTATIAEVSDAQLRAGLVSKPSDAFFEPVRYLEELVGNTAVVSPDLPYLDLVHNGGPIFAAEPYEAWDASDYPPVLDVKLANTSRETVLAAEVVVDVASSRPDLEPIPVFVDALNRHGLLFIHNEGWGSGSPVELRFALEPDGTRPVWGREPHRVRLPRGLEEETYVSLDNAFRKEGVDVAVLSRAESRVAQGLPISPALERRLGTAVGRFKFYRDSGFSRAVCFGRILYRLPNGRDRSVKFVTGVTVWAPLEGNPPTSAEPRTHALELDPTGKNYRRVVPIHEELKPGQAIRFGLSLLVPRSSKHEFTLRVVTADGLTLSSRPFRMSILSPRSQPFERLRAKLQVEHEPA
jgi:hypothetical protein